MLCGTLYKIPCHTGAPRTRDFRIRSAVAASSGEAINAISTVAVLNGGMVSTLLKGVFGVFILLGAALLALLMWASYALGGLAGALPLLIFVGVGGLLVWLSARAGAARGAHAAATIAQPAANPSVFQGHGADIELREHCLAITRHGAGSFLTQGLKGEKRILYSSITAIQLRNATRNLGGYIQFTILGGNESVGGIWDATTDENTVMFSDAQAPRFGELRDIVERRLEEAHQVQRSAPSPSIADELAKLAGLRSNGILTEEEFVQQKARVLAH